MKELVIAPSILSLDYSRTSELLKQLDSLHSYDLLNQYAMKSLTIAPDNPKAYCWLIRSLKAHFQASHRQSGFWKGGHKVYQSHLSDVHPPSYLHFHSYNSLE